MTTLIADTASVDPRASLDDDVEVGPYCIVGPDVRIGRGTRLIGHACILGETTLGAGNVVYPFVVLGAEPPPIPQRVGAGRLEIGDGNVFREHVSVGSGSGEAGGRTRIGSRNLLMAGSRVGHDATLADVVTLGDGTLMAEGARVEAHATVSAGAAIHRRATVGASSFVGARARILHDVPPFMLVDGDPARVRGVNLIGLKRRGLSKVAVDALREAHRLLFRARMEIEPAAEILAAHGHRTPEVEQLLAALRSRRDGRHGRALDDADDGADPGEE